MGELSRHLVGVPSCEVGDASGNGNKAISTAVDLHPNAATIDGRDVCRRGALSHYCAAPRCSGSLVVFS